MWIRWNTSGVIIKNLRHVTKFVVCNEERREREEGGQEGGEEGSSKIL
jgi:hypothetical protein